MENQSLSVSIGNRQYNLKVPAGETENIRRAEKMLNEKLNSMRRNYSVNDSQDILAMCAFSLAGEVVGSQHISHKKDSSRLEQLRSLDEMLTGYLNTDQTVHIDT